ncbi:MAG: 2-desacetyl-2-hydroxyethyl bacteriochlorophyllide A dehydrogenase [Kiritimatiellia bacterium]|jgi:2-desacetyl-2-hydroxyethyl bacteriochlorophyllide A dehydrogenase
MKAIQLTEPHNFNVIDIDEPGAPGPGEALIRIDTVGICGTDLGGYLGKMPFFSYPRIPGHELGVTILEIGEGVDNIKVGDRCSVEPYINCQKCYSCRRGYTNCCEHHQTIGVMCDGGLTEKIILPARKMHPANNLTSEQCALVETLAIGCHAIDRGNPKSNESVLVIGAGPIGLSAVEFARLSGAKTIVMDMVQSRLDFCKDKMGVDHTILAGSGNEIEALEALTDGNRADVVVDATGSNHSMANALNYCAFKGRVVYVGITQAELALPHAPALHRRELDILASRNALSSDFTRIIKLIEDGEINTKPWITHRTTFDKMIGEFESFTKPETGVIKAVVEMG